MDKQSNTQISAQKPSNQKQQSPNSLPSQTNTLQNSEQQAVLQSEKKGLKWWMWLLIVAAAIGLAAGIYSVFM